MVVLQSLENQGLAFLKGLTAYNQSFEGLYLRFDSLPSFNLNTI
jgi:hypothetical protein